MKQLLAGTLYLLLFTPGYGQRNALSKPEKNFEAFWRTFQENYAHFQTRQVDWQAQYDKFRPLVTASTPDDTLFAVLNRMVEPLRDGHVVISRTGDLPASAKYSRFHQAFPTKEAVAQLRAVTAKTAEALGFRDYVKFNSKHYQIGGYAFSGQYGYLQLNGFGGLPLKEFEKQLDGLLSGCKDKKALIIDLRINGGGSGDYVAALVSRLIGEKLLASYGQRKVGSGPADFTPLNAYYIEPNPNHFTKPIILLTSGASISAADHFAMNMKGLPYVTLMGENTAGMFSSMMGKKLPNGWQYSLSHEKVLSRDQVCYEGTGVPVDIQAANTPQDVATGKDPVLIKAVEYLDAQIK